MEFQVTLFCTTGRYKPVSCIVNRNTSCDITDATVKRQLLNDGMQKICNKRGWSAKDLTTYGYKTGKVRVYDREAIANEAKERYEKIKEEKYASGEWKRPKNKIDTQV